MPNTISTKELKQKIDNQESFYLIDVLSPESYEARHLPTAVNITNGPGLVKQVAELGANKDDQIVVYCSSLTCGASPAAAKALEDAGYSNVYDYEEGLAGWQDAGYEFEGKERS